MLSILAIVNSPVPCFHIQITDPVIAIGCEQARVCVVWVDDRENHNL